MPRNPFGPPIRAAVPAELASEAALLAHLGMTVGELNKIRWYRDQMYQTFEIAKSGGKSRLISAPNKRLKHIQRQLLPLLYQLYQTRSPVHGFVFNRSVKTNAQSHLRRRFVLNLDLQDFFPTITENRVVGMLKAIGIGATVAVAIGYLCCIHGHLPQGAPTSPVLSNMICFRLDRELLAFAKASRCIYTRYADDITLSSHQPMSALFEGSPPPAGNFANDLLVSALTAIVVGNGFTINPMKAHYANRHSRRMVTGLKINDLLNVDRRYIRNIRAVLHSVETLGFVGAQTKYATSGGTGSLAAHLRGKIAWISHIKGPSDPVVRSIALRFNTCFADRKIMVTPTPIERRERSVWIVEHDDGQGTGFFLSGVGLVTAAHCVTGKREVEVFHPSKHANTFKATVLQRDDHLDLAILGHEIPATEYYELNRAALPVVTGDPMTAVGYPKWAPGDPLNVRPGVVSTVTIKSAVRLIEVTQKLTQGMSGGPLLDANGDVAGVVHKGGPEEGRDFAIHVEVLNSWLAHLAS
ncbi:RNA-directed DNA polymerase [Breoghania corrubedonensis]|uniref:RNA-directed DNA polymerase n=1 Tax=Breoghania corrubedonensis TaxID=665038 RepID=A0A2T5UQX6_9HYPH|nr:trypsin-like peptidase domain-containing protein [Breoghania corrubedonensis]PTW53883.1 RNA-directed DNA polymerase [Breoghania corrubedonensis]